MINPIIESTWKLKYRMYVVMTYFQCFNLTLCSFLIIFFWVLIDVDLLLMLRNPFYPVSRRLIKYRLAFCFFFLIASAFSIYNINEVYRQQIDPSIYGITLNVLFVGSIMMQILSVMIVFKLCQKRRGLNKGTFRTFTRHYLIYDLSFMPSNWTFIYMFIQEYFFDGHR